MSKEAAARAELARLKAERSGVGQTTLGLDPGTSATGIAVVQDGSPVFVDVVRVRGASAEDRLPEMCRRIAGALRTLYDRYNPSKVAIEWQMIRPSDKRPNDILNMAMVLGVPMCIELPDCATLLRPLPVQWKGSGDPDAFTRRIRALYPNADEMMHAVPAGLKHNGYDALGLAVWAIRKALPWQP